MKRNATLKSWVQLFLIAVVSTVTLQGSAVWTGYWKGYEPVVPWKESWTADKKMGLISEKMDGALEISPPFYDYLDLLRQLGMYPLVPGIKMQSLMDRSTWRPKISDRKALHTQGTYGRARIVWTEGAKQFTGVFQDGVSEHVVLNYSNGFRLPQISNFFGLSMNIHRDGTTPASLLTAYNFFSIPNWNIFGMMHCNHYNWVYGLPLLPYSSGSRGNSWTAFFSMMGTSDMGTFDSSGRLYNQVSTPFALCFKPTDKLKAEFEGFPPFKHPSELLQFVEEDEYMYELMAVTHPEALMHVKEQDFMKYVVKVGDVQLKSKLRRCEYCDATMNVRHTRMEEDLAHHPSWVPYVTKLKYQIRTGSMGLYQHIMPPVDNDVSSYQLAITRYTNSLLKDFSSVDNFVTLLDRLGLTPDELYEEQIKTLIDTVRLNTSAIMFPNRYPPDQLPIGGATLKISPRWFWRLYRMMGESYLTYLNGINFPIVTMLKPTDVFQDTLSFINGMMLNVDRYYNEPQLEKRIKLLRTFMRTSSSLLTSNWSNKCNAFDNTLFMDCHSSKSWMLDQACHMYVIGSAQGGDLVDLKSNIYLMRHHYCKMDPPRFIDMTTNIGRGKQIHVGSTLFADSPVLKFPTRIDDEYLAQLTEELRQFSID